jgi:hypothetical protein
MTGCIWRATAALAALLALGQAVFAADPKLPAGQDPGGIAVAIIGGGVDYTLPGIATRVARDGEGELIGWDVVEDDRAPFAVRPADASSASVDGTAHAELVLQAYNKGRLVPVRVAPGDPQALAKAVAFVAGTPARIVAIAQPLDSALMRMVIRQAAERFKDHVFIVTGDPNSAVGAASGGRAAAAGTSGKAPAAGMAGAEGGALPSLLNLGNVLVVTAPAEAAGQSAAQLSASADLLVLPRGGSMFGVNPAAPPRNGAEAVMLAAAATACQGHGREPLAGSAAKAAVLDAGRPLPEAPSLRGLDPICWYGGVRY